MKKIATEVTNGKWKYVKVTLHFYVNHVTINCELLRYVSPYVRARFILRLKALNRDNMYSISETRLSLYITSKRKKMSSCRCIVIIVIWSEWYESRYSILLLHSDQINIHCMVYIYIMQWYCTDYYIANIYILFTTHYK